MIFKRWSCRIVGTESGRTIELDFVRFWTKAGAEAYAERLERLGGDLELTRIEAYRRTDLRHEVLYVLVVGALLVAPTLLFVWGPAPAPMPPPTTACGPVER